MKKTLTLAIFAATAICRNWIQSAPLQSGAPPAAPTSFRIVFGGDAVQGSGKWKLTIKRSVLETQPDQPRALTSQGQIPILVPAGVTVTVDAPAMATAHLATAQGTFDFRLRD